MGSAVNDKLNKILQSTNRTRYNTENIFWITERAKHKNKDIS